VSLLDRPPLSKTILLLQITACCCDLQRVPRKSPRE
jgi:hypothetical protein